MRHKIYFLILPICIPFPFLSIFAEQPDVTVESLMAEIAELKETEYLMRLKRVKLGLESKILTHEEALDGGIGLPFEDLEAPATKMTKLEPKEAMVVKTSALLSDNGKKDVVIEDSDGKGDNETTAKKKGGTLGELNIVDYFGYETSNPADDTWVAEKGEEGNKVRVGGPARNEKTGRMEVSEFHWYNALIWDLEWKFGTLGSRVNFDIGDRDDGEVNIFGDGGDVQLSLDFLTLYGHRPFFGTDLDWGPTTSFGIGSNSSGSGDTAVLLLSYGFFLRPQDSQWQLELGGMTGFSSDPTLNSSTRDDSAVYVGISFGSLIDSAKSEIKPKN